MTRKEFLSINHPFIEEYYYPDVVVYFLWNEPSERKSITLKGSIWIYNTGKKTIALKDEVLKKPKELESVAFSIKEENLMLLDTGKKYVIGRLFGDRVRQE